jgi:hypothetical protein
MDPRNGAGGQEGHDEMLKPAKVREAERVKKVKVDVPATLLSYASQSHSTFEAACAKAMC